MSGSDALEARIVAWVLGEASEFEASELQWMCDEQPELEVFRRRISAVHGLAGEAMEQPQTDWKLPPAKRGRVLELIGARASEVRREQTSRFASRRVLLSVAACLALTLVVAALVFPMFFRARAWKGGGRNAEAARVSDFSSSRDSEMERFDGESDDFGAVTLGGGSHAASDFDGDKRKDYEGLRTRAAGTRTERQKKRTELRELEKSAVEELALSDGASLAGDAVIESGISGKQQALRRNAPMAAGKPVAPAKPEARPEPKYLYTPGGEVAGPADRPVQPQTALQAVVPPPPPATSAPIMVPESAGKASAFAEATADRLAGNESNFGSGDDFGDGFGGMGGGGAADGKREGGRPVKRLGDDAELGLVVDDLRQSVEWAATNGRDGYSLGGGVSKGVVSSGAVDAKGWGLRADHETAGAYRLEAVDSTWAMRGLATEGKKEAELADVEARSKGDSWWSDSTVEPGESAAERLDRGHGLDRSGREDVERDHADKAEVEVVREFIHPTEFEPPELPNEPAADKVAVLGDIPALDSLFKQSDRNGQLVVEASEDSLGRVAVPVDGLPEAPTAAAAIDLMAEVATGDEPFSTFSLHVSDASFRLSASALERGERPDPESVRPEEFYNAFDYGDPAPGAGEPVACAIEQSAHPLLPSRNLVRIGVRTAAAGRGAGQALRLTVLLDNSGSMEREDRRTALQEAMKQLGSLLGPDDVVTVVGFARQPRLLADRLSGDAARAELEQLVDRTPAEGGTNLEQALALADELARRQFDPGAQNRIVLLTDGAANLGNADPEQLATRIEGLRQQGVSFDAAGFGTAGLNDDMLERLTRDGNGRYYVVDGPEDAGPQFAKKLAGAFRPAAENVKVQVRFNQARVGRYRLIGFEEHRLEKEDFRDDSVDAAEMASEEAGVALYQVELLPGGEGEIGEVSVRFRDAAKRRMVERSWTIGHAEWTPAFDQSTPSMQVAGLAALAADALRDGPLAPLTDWAELAPVAGQVRQHFGAGGRIGQLLGMIERLRE